MEDVAKAVKISRAEQTRRGTPHHEPGKTVISGTLFKVRQFARRLWVRAALVSALAFVAPLAALPLASLVPDWVLTKITLETVRALLDILANSMLAVTTFSLTIMVTAHLAADRGASPRGHRLLREDGRTQTVLATFVGSFVYALVSIVLLQTGFATEASFSGFYLMTLVVFAVVILTILRWIGQLASLGSIEATIRAAEDQARQVLAERKKRPFLGARRFVPGGVPRDAHSVASPKAGYIRHIDTARLSTCAGERQAIVYVAASPGDFVAQGAPLAHIAIDMLTDEAESAFAACFTIGQDRSFEQDPAFALRVLTEIADRALSPGINDPETARDITMRLVMLLTDLEPENEADDPAAPLVHVAPLNRNALLYNCFDPIARDGRAFFDVQLDLQKAMTILSGHRDPEIAGAAIEISKRALEYARQGLLIPEDIDRLARVAPGSEAKG